MSNYTISSKEHEHFIEFITEGNVEGISEMMEYSGIPLQGAISKGHKKVLIDESKISITLSDMDQMELMNFFLNDFPKSLDVKFSVIFNERNEEVVKLFSELADKVGFDCKFYSHREEAVEALLK